MILENDAMRNPQEIKGNPILPKQQPLIPPFVSQPTDLNLTSTPNSIPVNQPEVFPMPPFPIPNSSQNQMYPEVISITLLLVYRCMLKKGW